MAFDFTGRIPKWLAIGREEGIYFDPSIRFGTALLFYPFVSHNLSPNITCDALACLRRNLTSPHVQAPTLLQNQGNPNPFGTGESIQYDEGGAEAKDSGANYGRLRDKLNEADVERRKIEEEAKNRERAAEMKREERLKKIAYMRDMPEDTPAGTGEFRCLCCKNNSGTS